MLKSVIVQSTVRWTEKLFFEIDEERQFSMFKRVKTTLPVAPRPKLLKLGIGVIFGNVCFFEAASVSPTTIQFMQEFKFQQKNADFDLLHFSGSVFKEIASS